jgi:PAS domain S-box-containing protein
LRRRLSRKDVANSILGLSRDLSFVAGTDGYFRYLSDHWAPLTGQPLAEIYDNPMTAVVYAEDANATWGAFFKLSAGETLSNFTNRIRGKNGPPRWVQWNALMDADGKRVYAIGHDISDARELLQRSMMFDAAVTSAVDAILTIDEFGTIKTANPAAEKLFGFATREILGRNIKMLMPSPYREQHDGYLSNYLTTGNKRIIGIGRQVRAQRRDGTTFPISLAVSESRIGSERVFTGIIRDISEVEKADRLKSEFISTVSHELRTPLTSIRGSLGLIAGGVLGDIPSEAEEMLKIAVNNSDRLVRLVNDLLDIEKIEAGTIELSLKPVDLQATVERSLAENRSYADAHGTWFNFVSLPKKVVVRGDEDRLLQVIANLLSNAAKYSPAGKSVDLTIAESQEGWFTLFVRDHGPGISPEFEPRVFARFAQADSSATRRVGGTGLGLSISKAIIDRLGGRIGFDRSVSPGARFYVSLPPMTEMLSSVRMPRLSRQMGMAAGDSNETARILHIEDDSSNRRIVSEALKNIASVDFAATISAAKKYLVQNSYDVLLLDLALPDGRGETLLPEVSELPVIIFSANDAPAEVQDRVAGAFVKSRDSVDSLVDLIQEILGRLAER